MQEPVRRFSPTTATSADYENIEFFSKKKPRPATPTPQTKYEGPRRDMISAYRDLYMNGNNPDNSTNPKP